MDLFKLTLSLSKLLTTVTKFESPEVIQDVALNFEPVIVYFFKMIKVQIYDF